MSGKNKWLTQREAWKLALELSKVKTYGNIQTVASKLGIAHATIYRWGEKRKRIPDVRITEALKELAIKEGIIKA